MIGAPELILLLVLGGGFLGLGAYLIGLVAYHAYRRGYNPVVWGLTAVPRYLMELLAIAFGTQVVARVWGLGCVPHSRLTPAENVPAGHDIRPADGLWTPAPSGLRNRAARPAWAP
jgi:hypothetical protein